MSESRANLEQILELLLAEENEQAEELLHEYVVAKARQQYERVLDESEEVEKDLDESEEVDESSCGSDDEDLEEMMDHSNPSENFKRDVAGVTDIADEVAEDEYTLEGDDEDDAEMGMDMDDMDDMGDMDAEEGDVEDKIDDLEDELQALKAEFEKLMSDDDEAEDDADDAMDDAMDADTEIRFDQDSIEESEYDLDEDFDTLEEATKLSDQVSPQSTTKLNVPDPGADNNQSPFTKTPGAKSGKGGKPVHMTDGGEGDHGEKGSSNPQDPGNHNMNIDPKSNAGQQTKAKLSVPNPGADGSNGKSPFTKQPS
jgi:outer membrane murein-binding lipoprotein Lpp